MCNHRHSKNVHNGFQHGILRSEPAMTAAAMRCMYSLVQTVAYIKAFANVWADTDCYS